MSWQLASFTILAVALAGGFAWYERSAPDARIVALVGTLAAFAALGRIAFAALPNVKPTTDIVLIAGYALGGAPGFVVGAVAGLTSNFFFGQGPWTPWQMVAWGVCGLLGAALQRSTRRPVGRWRLALVCAVIGYGFAAFQDFGDWVTYSDHSWAQLGVYVGKGTGFDLIHAAGCFGFALAFGPALARALRRFDQRLHVEWQPAVMILCVAAGGLALGVRSATPARAATSPTGYLNAAQNPDGGFGAAPGTSSSELFAGWAALGLAAAHENPAVVTRDGHSVLAYVEAGVQQLGDVGSLERTILVARAAGASATSFAGVDLLARLRRAIRADGSVSEQVNLTAFAILALRAAGEPAPAASVAWLQRQQDADGGFNFATAGGSSDIDDTGAALEALRASSGARAGVRARAVGFLRRAQNADGGFPASPGADSNAQSTAFAVQGLLAAGVNPGSLHRHGARSPVQYLNSLIAPDGHVRYSRSSDQTPVWVTAEAAMALAAQPLPIAATPLPARPAAPPRAVPRVRQHVARRPAPVHHRARRAAKRTGPQSSPSSPAIDRLITYAGFLAAVALAPAGL